MKNIIPFLTIPLLLLFTTRCESPGSSMQGWSLQMQGMAEAYEKLLPYMYDSQRYQNPNNEKFISLYLKNLNESASGLNRHTGKGLSGNDPLFAVGLVGLKTMIKKASESYFVESYEYSQKLLQASVQYCNSCHTRTNLGPTFIKWDKFESITSQMNPVDHADILVATRQFPKAVEILEQGLVNQKIDKKQRQKALEKAMVVTLRNLQDPQKALDVLDKTSSPNKDWKAYLVKWKKGQLKKTKTTAQLLKTAKVEGSHFVEAIHNSLVLHQALSAEVAVPKRAQIYFSLGKIYKEYSNLVSWRLPENYFETCIYQVPGTQLALKCYYALESLQIKNPKLESNPLTNIQKAKLRKLKVLATEKPANKGPVSFGVGTEDL